MFLLEYTFCFTFDQGVWDYFTRHNTIFKTVKSIKQIYNIF